MVDRTFERIDPFKGRQVGGGQTSYRHDAELRGYCVAPVGLYLPPIGGLVENRLGDPSVKADVTLEVKSIRHVVRVGEDFWLWRILLRPVPLLIERLVKRVGVLHALDIAPRPRVAIPIPCAAYAAARFEYPTGESELAQRVQHVEAAKPGSHDDRVEYCAVFGFSPARSAVVCCLFHGQCDPQLVFARQLSPTHRYSAQIVASETGVRKRAPGRRRRAWGVARLGHHSVAMPRRVLSRISVIRGLARRCSTR